MRYPEGDDFPADMPDEPGQDVQLAPPSGRTPRRGASWPSIPGG